MRRRAYAAAVIAGLTAVAVLAALVLSAGRLDPSPPSLQDNPVPQIPGQILYLDAEGCIIRAAASGAERDDVLCPGTDVNLITWVDADTIAFQEFGPRRPFWTEVDLETGKATTTDREPAVYWSPDPVSVHGDRVDIGEDGSVYVVGEDGRRQVFEFDGPEHRWPRLVTWSPDGEWILLQYEDELWIVSRRGDVQGTLAKTRPYDTAASWWVDGLGALPEPEPAEDLTPPRRPGSPPPASTQTVPRRPDI